jgi:hypothetical protein
MEEKQQLIMRQIKDKQQPSKNLFVNHNFDFDLADID